VPQDLRHLPLQVTAWSSFAADNPDGNAALTRLVDRVLGAATGDGEGDRVPRVGTPKARPL
jgi:hypothetical protein